MPDEHLGHGDPENIPFTQRARRALALARDESVKSGHNYIGTEHILLGMAGLGDGIGFMLLQGRGIGVEQLEVELANVKRGD